MKTTIITVVIAFLTIVGKAQKVYLVKEKANLKLKPEPLSSIITTVFPGDTISVLGYYDGYWHVIAKQKDGFVSEIFMPANSDIYPAKEDYNKRKGIVEYKLAKYIKIGVTTDDVLRLIGSPTTINRTVIGDDTHLQWVFDKENEKIKYYYFTNGKLTAWQD